MDLSAQSHLAAKASDHSGLPVDFSDWSVLWANEALHRLLGYAETELIDQPCRNLFPDRASCERFWQEVLHQIGTRNYFKGQVIQRRKDGAPAYCEVSVQPVEGVSRAYLASFDIAAPSRERRRNIADQLQVLAAISDGVIVFSGQGQILFSNPSFDTMFGYEAGELIGRDIAMLNGDDTADAETSAQEVRRALREEGTWQGDSISRRKDGTRFWTNSTISSHTLPEQEPMWIAVVRDTTQRRALEDELKHSKEQLELAMRGSSSGMWSVDMLGGDMVCDARVFEIFGLDPQRGAMTRERWVGAIHPDDLEYAVAVFRQHLKGETPIFQIEHRIRHTDGHWVWVLASGKVMERTENGWATRIIGTCQDVSAQKRLTQETENLMIRLESFLKSAGMSQPAGQRPPPRSRAADQLTRREKAVLVLIAEGLTSTQIAQRMHLSPGTIGSHRRNLMAKLDLHSSAEVTRFALEHGLLSD